MKTKRCYTCKRTKSVARFSKAKNSKDGLYYQCRPCKGKRESGPTRKYYLKRVYGITPEEYNRMLDAQGGVCAICRRPQLVIRVGRVDTFDVDHDHATGKVRGLLCGKCNAGMGMMLDDVDIVHSAYLYLKSHKTEVPASGPPPS